MTSKNEIKGVVSLSSFVHARHYLLLLQKERNETYCVLLCGSLLFSPLWDLNIKMHLGKVQKPGIDYSSKVLD
jgi:hypothetical protein